MRNNAIIVSQSARGKDEEGIIFKNATGGSAIMTSYSK